MPGTGRMMTALRPIAALFAVLITAGGAFAQEAAPQADPATPPVAAPAEGAVQAALDIREFTDWELRCTEDKANCFMYQMGRDASANPVVEVTLISLPEGNDAAAGVTVATPLGTLLTQGLVLQVDSNTGKQYPFNWCTRSGCFARFGLTHEELEAMQKGAKARFRIVSASAPDAPVVVEISLSGFTAAFAAMTE